MKYENIPIDAKVRVWDEGRESFKHNRYFAGVSSDGLPMTWSRGRTSREQTSFNGRTTWDYCESAWEEFEKT